MRNKAKRKKGSSYVGDFKEVDWASSFDDNWADPKKDLPSTNSHQEVIIARESHGGDVRVVCGFWLPRDGYTEGDFFVYSKRGDAYKARKLDIDRIYLWRGLNFM